MSSEKKVAVISGALGGIGSEISRKLIKSGYRVVAMLVPNEVNREEKWMQEEGATADQVRFFPVDITDHKAVMTGLETILKEEGRVDALINNAGITRDSTFKKMTYEQWSAVLDTNLKSLFAVTQPVFQMMLEQGFGRIVNISSVNGLKGQFGQANYSAAKAGIIGFTKALALEGARKGVCVNSIAPGYTATAMVSAMREDVVESIKQSVPMNRLATPEEIAAAVLYLVGPDSGYITGETLSVNGGLYMQ